MVARSLLGALIDRVAPRGPLGIRAPAVSNFAPVPYVSRRSGSFGLTDTGTSTRDMTTAIDSYGTLGTLFAIVNRCAVETAGVEWKLWRKAPSGLDEDRVEVTAEQHAAARLWAKPNDFMAQAEFVEVGQQYLDLTGEKYWLCVNAAGFTDIGPLEMWPIRPDRIVPVPDPKKYLAGYVYKSPDGERIPLPLSAVIQIRMPNPRDPFRGLGPVQALLTDIDSARYSAEWNRNFFINGAAPGGIVEVPETMNDDEYNRFNQSWRDQHQGTANAHRVAIIEGGAKWVERKYSMSDMQFVQLRDLSREVIREAFGFPKFALGSVDDVNRATADASLYALGQLITKPRAKRMKGVLNHELLPMFGKQAARDFEWDFKIDLPADREGDDRERESKAKAANLLTAAGYAPDEVCAAVGLPIMRTVAPPKKLGGAGTGERSGDDAQA